MAQVIAYSYETDRHCVDCAIKRFGDPDDDVVDGEGNPVYPVFDTDEWYADELYLGVTGDVSLCCGTCGEMIDEVTLEPNPHVSSTLLRIRRAAESADHNPDL